MLLFFYGFTFGECAPDCRRRAREEEWGPASRRGTEREVGILYFRNVTQCHCKIWNINASRHSHNRPRTNRPVRSVLFFPFFPVPFFFIFQCVFIVRGMVPALFPSKFSSSPSLSLSCSLFFCCSLFSSFSPSFVHRSKMGREDATVAIITPLPRPDHSSLKSGQVSIYYAAHLNELKQISRNCQKGEQCTDLIKGPPFETNERVFSTRGFHSGTLFLFARRISAVIPSR